MLNVFLTGPNDLDRAVDLLSDFDSAGDAVALQPTSEATADQMIVHNDLVQR